VQNQSEVVPAARVDLPVVSPTADATPQWAKIIDQSRCIGCHACTTACKSENEVPLSVSRTYVKSVDVGSSPRPDATSR
jgi:Fe-S-cluster-containing dehydrogenase component